MGNPWSPSFKHSSSSQNSLQINCRFPPSSSSTPFSSPRRTRPLTLSNVLRPLSITHSKQGFRAPRKLLRRQEGKGKSLGFSSCCFEPALPSSRPVTLVGSLADSETVSSPVEWRLERRRGWMAVQVVRSAQVFLLSPPPPPPRPHCVPGWSVPPRPGVSGSPSRPAARREHSPPKCLLQQ